MARLAPALEGAAISATVTSNNLTLAYEQFGRDADPAVVLITDLGRQLLAWPDAFCRALADHGLRVIRFDNRDVGLSTALDHLVDYTSPRRAVIAGWLHRPVKAPYTLDDMADDALGLLDALGIERAHVVGASAGGMIAQLLAAQHPRRVSSLASIMASSGAAGLPRGKRRILLRMAQLPRHAPEDRVVAHMTRTMGMLCGRLGPATDACMADMRRAVRRSYRPAGVARQIVAMLAAPSRVELLRRIRQPALVIHGRADPLLPVRHGRDTARHLHTVRYEEMAGMGHCLPPGLLSDFVDMIVTLVRGVERVAPPRQNSSSI